MPLTPSQSATLKAAILADPTQAAKIPVGDYQGLVDWLNAVVAPAFILWRTSVPIDDIMRNGMAWDRVDNLSIGKARIWEWMGRLGTLDATKPNIRAGIDATWVGTAPDLAVRATVYTHCKRSATRAEKLLATGTGSDASPAVPGWEGTLQSEIPEILSA
jgi:hypothetical protein